MIRRSLAGFPETSAEAETDVIGPETESDLFGTGAVGQSEVDRYRPGQTIRVPVIGKCAVWRGEAMPRWQ
ncbi:MAG TPA: hypothetical protein DCP73_12065 [Chloroflexi bacterium]|nr:hypothetical protein [Chloroflexota bacterium]NDF40047.1 hypothetical protein [Pseudomonadota bacterium]HAN16278.1 hypothetical protein [Chloroflexota bacterium]